MICAQLPHLRGVGEPADVGHLRENRRRSGFLVPSQAWAFAEGSIFTTSLGAVPNTSVLRLELGSSRRNDASAKCPQVMSGAISRAAFMRIRI